MLKLLLGSNYGRNDTAEGVWGGGARCVPSQVSQTARCRESVFPLLRNSYALARLLNISKKKKMLKKHVLTYYGHAAREKD